MNADEKSYRNPENLLMRTTLTFTNSYDAYPLRQPYISLVALMQHVFFKQVFIFLFGV